VLEVGARYLKPARYDDTITIVTTLREKPLLRIKLEYEVRRGDELLATGFTLHAFIDREGKPVRPPASFRKRCMRCLPVSRPAQPSSGTNRRRILSAGLSSIG